MDTATFVAANTTRFAGLREHLALSFDDFIATSTDARHAAGVRRLWRQCAATGDFYRRGYTGLYCGGCEQFYTPGELLDGRCPEHLREPEVVEERNWFFRLSRYQDRLLQVLESGQVRITPAARRNEVLAFVRAGLADISVSRPAARAAGWGIAVPDDPDQVVYVWWDALTTYVTALGYGTDDPAYRHWWAEADERVHVIGKGIVRFHAVYWLALLLSAGQPLPTTIFVHDYLTVDGAKLSKSLGNTVDPAALVDRYGTDALRWWLLREVAPVGDTDFTADRLVHRANRDLAHALGNLVHRTLSLVHKYRAGHVPQTSGPAQATALTTRVPTYPPAPTKRWTASISAPLPTRYATSSTMPTGWSTPNSPGTWPVPNGPGTPRPPPASTAYSLLSCTPVACWPMSCSPSSRPAPAACMGSSATGRMSAGPNPFSRAGKSRDVRPDPGVILSGNGR